MHTNSTYAVGSDYQVITLAQRIEALGRVVSQGRIRAGMGEVKAQLSAEVRETERSGWVLTSLWRKLGEITT